MNARFSNTFAHCAAARRAALIAFVTAGDGDALAFMQRLPEAGVDVLEIGMPFSDPAADGPVIRAAGTRALDAGQTLRKTLADAAAVRAQHPQLPIVLMGYYNPIFVYGGEAFARDAAAAGVDACIIVDLPPEEEAELPLHAHDLTQIRLATPTSDQARLATVVEGARGFIYVVSVTGVTGTKAGDVDAARRHVAQLRALTDTPIAVGFGLRDVQLVHACAQFADGVVVGSALTALRQEQGDDAALAWVRTLHAATVKDAAT